jgi:hypothetical protein
MIFLLRRMTVAGAGARVCGNANLKSSEAVCVGPAGSREHIHAPTSSSRFGKEAFAAGLAS